MQEVVGDNLSRENVSICLWVCEIQTYLSILSSGLAFLRYLKAFVR